VFQKLNDFLIYSVPMVIFQKNFLAPYFMFSHYDYFACHLKLCPSKCFCQDVYKFFLNKDIPHLHFIHKDFHMHIV